MNEIIRATIHDALDVREPAGLRSRVMAAVPMDRPRRAAPRMRRMNWQWAAGSAAILLTAALLLALAGTRIGLRPEPSRNDTSGSGARLINPSGIAIAPDGTVYVADYAQSRVYRLKSDGTLERVAGGGFLYEGTATKANLFGPIGLSFGSNGDLFIAENPGARVSKLDRQGNLSTVLSWHSAGSPNAPWGVAVGPSGLIYVSLGGMIGVIHADGSMSRIDLSGVPAPAVWPGYLAFDAAGNLYVSDLAPVTSSFELVPAAVGGCRILRITPNDSVSVIAGAGRCGYSGDGGPAVGAQLDNPRGLAFDGAGNLYVADSNNDRIRRIDTHGVITTVAGTGGYRHTGDGGPALNAELQNLSGVAIAQDRFLYFVEDGSFNVYGAVRVIDLLTGIVRTVADTRSRVVS